MSIGLIGSLASKKAKKGAKGKSGQNNVSDTYVKNASDKPNSNAARAAAGNNGFIANAKVSKKPASTVPDYLKQTAVTAASQNAQAAQDAADPSNNPILAALLAAALKGGGSTGGTQTFSGNLADYIAKAGKAIPGVSYASEENSVKKNAASGQKDIGSMYAALAAYTAGQKPAVAQQYADSASNIKTSNQDAAALGNSLYGSLQGNMQQGAGSVAAEAQGTAAVGQQAALDQNATHKSALADALALGEQSALVNNSSQGNAAQGWITNSGNAAQLAGTQSKADISKALISQLAQYATLQSQADAQKASQALQLGSSQFNSDRSYAEQQAAAAASASNSQFDNLYKYQTLLDSESQNSIVNQLTAGKANDASTAANASQANGIYKSVYAAEIAQGVDPKTANSDANAAVRNAGYGG